MGETQHSIPSMRDEADLHEAETPAARMRRRACSIAYPRWARAQAAPRASMHASRVPLHGRTRRHLRPGIRISAPIADECGRRNGLALRGWSPSCQRAQALERPSDRQPPRRRSRHGRSRLGLDLEEPSLTRIAYRGGDTMASLTASRPRPSRDGVIRGGVALRGP